MISHHDVRKDVACGRAALSGKCSGKRGQREETRDIASWVVGNASNAIATAGSRGVGARGVVIASKYCTGSGGFWREGQKNARKSWCNHGDGGQCARRRLGVARSGPCHKWRGPTLGGLGAGGYSRDSQKAQCEKQRHRS